VQTLSHLQPSYAVMQITFRLNDLLARM